MASTTGAERHQAANISLMTLSDRPITLAQDAENAGYPVTAEQPGVWRWRFLTRHRDDGDRGWAYRCRCSLVVGLRRVADHKTVRCFDSSDRISNSVHGIAIRTKSPNLTTTRPEVSTYLRCEQAGGGRSVVHNSRLSGLAGFGILSARVRDLRVELGRVASCVWSVYLGAFQPVSVRRAAR
jgi:hypothetical protein